MDVAIKTPKFLTALFLSCAMGADAQAARVTQNFDPNWTVASWNAPGDATLGALQSLRTATWLEGSRDAASVLAYRYGFFTGWSPGQFQFADAQNRAGGLATFAATRSPVSGTDFALNLGNLYFPQANYYFDSRSAVTHSRDAGTDVVYEYTAGERVSEPAGHFLMLVALGVLAVAVRRQSPL